MHNFIKTSIIKNWKTTTVGIIIAITGFISFSPELFGGEKTFIVQLSHYINAGGLVSLGIMAKDYNVSGRN